MNDLYAITAVYKFTPLKEEELEGIQKELDAKGQKLKMIGLLLIATEGINGTVSGSTDAIKEFKSFLEKKFGSLTFKDSEADKQPFKRWFVKIRDEIVGLGDTSVVPASEDNNHIPPEEWNRLMEEEDIVVLDTRNDYETKIGIFEGAVDPNLQEFSQFPQWVEQCGIPKTKKVLMYCTGGIRCEKASIEMQKQGYKHVYQLKGGILQYLKECPDQKYKGECFVFDHRAAVDQNLQPSSRYTLCPHCGDPGDQAIRCENCGNDAIICDICKKQDVKNTCSKDCAHQFARKQVQKSMSEAK